MYWYFTINKNSVKTDSIKLKKNANEVQNVYGKVKAHQTCQVLEHPDKMARAKIKDTEQHKNTKKPKTQQTFRIN